MLQQVFVPASGGIIKSAPSSLIPNGSFQEALNVRFGDGYVEKVEGFNKVLTLDNEERVMKIHQYKKKNGSVKNIVHTKEAVYLINSIDEGDEPVDLTDGLNYSVTGFGHISSVNAFDEYFFTSLGSYIYYWNTDESKVKVLEGTFDAIAWQASHAYSLGDIVRPTQDNYTGFIYKCIEAGTSGATEPEWTEDMVNTVADNGARWIACGSLELEGQDSDHISLRAQCVELFKGFLFVANTIEGGDSYPSRLRWSQWQNPRLWHNNEDGSGLSGYVDVDDTDGKIMALKRIGDVLYVYKQNSIIAITYTGDTDTVFSKEVVTTKAGLIAPEAIVELPHMNVFVGEDDIYFFDGNTCTGIGDSIKDWLFSKLLDKSSVERVFGYYDDKHQEVLFCFNKNVSGTENSYIYDTDEDYGLIADDSALQKNCDCAIVYNIRLKTWSLRDVNATAISKIRLNTRDAIIDDVNTQYDDNSNDVIIDSGLYSGVREYVAAGDKDGNIYIINGYSDSREPLSGYEGYVITKTHHMEEPGKIKRLMRIQFHIETIECGDNDTGHSLYCQVGTAWSPENRNSRDITWTAKKYLNLKKPVASYSNHVVPYIDFDLSARYFLIRFGTTGNDTYFKVLGYTLYYQVRGDE